MMLERLGKCRYCDYEPIANTARFCPRCAGTSPYEAGFPWITVSLLLLILIAGGAGYLYFMTDLF